MTDTLLQSVSELLTTSECSLVSVTLKGIQDRFCPSMKREEKKRLEEMELASAIDDEEEPEETVSEELCRVCW